MRVRQREYERLEAVRRKPELLVIKLYRHLRWTHGATRRTPSLAGTNPGTSTAYLRTALPTVGPYALPVPGLVIPELVVVQLHRRLRSALRVEG